MATTTPANKPSESKAPDAKSDVSPAADVRAAEATLRPKQRDNAQDMLKYRADHKGAREAAIEQNEALAKNLRAAVKDAVSVDEAASRNPVQNQVPQEGALVETPPQPVPPSYSDAELKEMDHAPLGMREPSVAAGASSFEDYDQTVHPESRVNDPRFPL
jgi:hypothetical protein